MIFYIKERQMKNNFSKKKKCHKSNFIYKISKKFKLENVDF